MDVFFETQRGSPFSIEIGYFDTVLEIKQKIQKYQHIPVSKQSLFFHGNLLKDEQDIEQCEILNNSRLLLILSSPCDDQTRNNHKQNQVLKTEQSSPSNSIDQPHLQTIGQDLANVMNKGTSNSKKLRIMLFANCGTRKIPMEVNASDNVGELRKELVKIQKRYQFNLPEEGYFFIYKQDVMDDDRSFRWHRVDNGDNIEIFSGRVSGGS